MGLHEDNDVSSAKDDGGSRLKSGAKARRSDLIRIGMGHGACSTIMNKSPKKQIVSEDKRNQR